MTRGRGRVLAIGTGTEGHHLGYTPRALLSLAELGYEVHAVGMDRAMSLLDEVLTDLGQPAAVSRITLHGRHVPDGRRSKGRRRFVQSALELAGSLDATLVIDLQAENLLWAWPARPGPIPRVHVLHQIRPAGRSPTEVAGTLYWARQLRRLTERNGTVVVHTDAAHRVVRRVVGRRASVRLLPHPAGFADVPEAPNAVPGRLSVAGAFGYTPGKQLSLLAEALRVSRDWTELVVIGAVAGDDADMLRSLDRPVTLSGVLTGSHFDRALRSSSMTLLPYSPSFSTRGCASGVLADALRNGVPAVATPALATALPQPIPSVELAADNSPEAFAEAIDLGLSQLDLLSAAATGPSLRLAYGELGWDRYVRGLAGEIDGRRVDEDRRPPGP